MYADNSPRKIGDSWKLELQIIVWSKIPLLDSRELFGPFDDAEGFSRMSTKSRSKAPNTIRADDRQVVAIVSLGRLEESWKGPFTDRILTEAASDT